MQVKYPFSLINGPTPINSVTPVGSSPNGNAASISGSALTLQPANGTNPGVLTAGTQTIGGSRTFSASSTTFSNLVNMGSLSTPSGSISSLVSSQATISTLLSGTSTTGNFSLLISNASRMGSSALYFTPTTANSTMTLTGRLVANAFGTNDGIQATASGSNTSGVFGTGGTNGVGVWGTATGTSAGVFGTGPTKGGEFTCNSASGVGVQGTGGSAGGDGVVGKTQASSNASGVYGECVGTGQGGYFISGTNAGSPAVVCIQRTASQVAIRLGNQATLPASGMQAGDMVVQGGILKIYNGSAWVSVGAQP